MSESWENPDCPFCAITGGRARAKIFIEWRDAIAFEPLNPVVPGHTLIVPKQHVADFAEDPEVSALTMRRAAEHAGTDPAAVNLITSRGRAATQSVTHLHLHLVPRRNGDALALPWDPQGEGSARTEGKVAEAGGSA